MKTRLAAGRPGGIQCPCRQKKEDSMEQKYFTLDEVAAMLRLTPRTIRSYLASGALSGARVGGRWRFTEEDIQNLMTEDRTVNTNYQKTNAAVRDFLEGVDPDGGDGLRVCMVLDLPARQEEALERALEVCRMAESSSGLTFRFDQLPEEQRARFVVISGPEFAAGALKALSGG